MAGPSELIVGVAIMTDGDQTSESSADYGTFTVVR